MDRIHGFLRLHVRGRRRIALALLLAACLCASGCARKAPAPAAKVLLDGAPWDGEPVSTAADDLRVYVTLDGDALIDLPFGEAHAVEIVQADGSVNALRLTGEAVFMEHANCENQDCVQMGEVTRDNLELRVMGGFIVCLPHRVSVEVRGE